jgi:putative membrane protein
MAELVANRRDIQLFFRGCVIVAGVFGGLTAKITLLFTQVLPGAIAFLLVIAARPEMRDKMP